MATVNPLYSYAVEQLGLMSMVLSIPCAEMKCGDCRAIFRCDHACHRRVIPAPVEAT